MNSKQACKLLNFSQRIGWIYAEIVSKTVDYLEVLTAVKEPASPSKNIASIWFLSATSFLLVIFDGPPSFLKTSVGCGLSDNRRCV